MPPVQPHHRRAASCIICSACDINNPQPDPHMITGDLVGGPGQDDSYVDVRGDYVKNEVTLDYNATRSFTSLVARFCSS